MVCGDPACGVTHPEQGDVYRIAIPEGEGHEHRGEKRVVVLSSDDLISRTHVAICAPLTSNGRFEKWPTAVRIGPGDYGAAAERVAFVICHQARALAAKRLARGEFLGRLPENLVQRTIVALANVGK